jgi:hypothetical protein
MENVATGVHASSQKSPRSTKLAAPDITDTPRTTINKMMAFLCIYPPPHFLDEA